MESLKQTIQKFATYIIVTIVLGALLLAYNTFYVSTLQEAKNIEAIRSENQLVSQSELGREILFILNNLKTIQLDIDFFSRDEYTQLQDFSEKITAKPVGTENPFQEVKLFFEETQNEEVVAPDVLDDAIKVPSENLGQLEGKSTEGLEKGSQ